MFKQVSNRVGQFVKFCNNKLHAAWLTLRGAGRTGAQINAFSLAAEHDFEKVTTVKHEYKIGDLHNPKSEFPLMFVGKSKIGNYDMWIPIRKETVENCLTW